MKKTLAILALVLFLGGFSATAVAATVDTKATIVLAEEKKAEEKKAEEKKAESKDCEAKKETTAKSSDCEKKCEGEKKK